MKNFHYCLASVLVFSLATVGCCCKNPPPRPGPPPLIVEEKRIHGTVEKKWVEPMYDSIRVPGQIDPTNTYYRAPHKTVVEIRPNGYDDVTYKGDR